MFAAFRSEVGPLDPTAYQPQNVADAENAAIRYREAAALLVLDEEEREMLIGLAGKPQWSEDD